MKYSSLRIFYGWFNKLTCNKVFLIKVVKMYNTDYVYFFIFWNGVSYLSYIFIDINKSFYILTLYVNKNLF